MSIQSSQHSPVVILDYGVGNLFSIKQACHYAGVWAILSHDKDQIEKASGLIIPGVGAFHYAMNQLKERDLIAPLKEFVKSGKPVMGICLGMQLLMNESEEFGTHKGLGILPGTVKFFPTDRNGKQIKIPHYGWAPLTLFSQPSVRQNPLARFNSGDPMYFVHSLYVECPEREYVTSTAEYAGQSFCASLQFKNVFACQFHPEKSGELGAQIYGQWFLTEQHPSLSSTPRGFAVAKPA